MLGSYTVQSELGDYDPNEHGPGIDYIKDMSFAPNQSEELLEKIAELHRTHRLIFKSNKFAYEIGLFF